MRTILVTVLAALALVACTPEATPSDGGSERSVLRGRVEDLEASVRELRRMVANDDLDARLSALDERLASIDASLADLAGRLGTVESSDGELHGAISELRGITDDLLGSLEDVRVDLSDLQSDHNLLRAEFESHLQSH